MARQLRIAPGGLAYHVMNRRIAKLPLFEKDGDYLAFEKVLAQARERYRMRICAYVFMENHWHLVLWPHHDGDLSDFMRWLTMTHTQRWHAHRQTVGSGHLYQSRFKSFPIEQDFHFLTVCRYVERNPLRANLVERAEHWPWCSLAVRREAGDRARKLLDDWPVDCPSDWLRTVNRPQNEKELEALRRSIIRSSPFGSDTWTARTARSLYLTSTLRPRGRPRKKQH